MDPENLPSPPILEQTGLLDTLTDEAFDRLTRLATRILQAPISLVTLVDGTRQYFKSCIGIPEPWSTQRQPPLSHSFCQHVVADATPLIIADATQHPRVVDNLAIRDLGVIAYLGIPLFTSEGQAIGSFCVIDTQPRSWTEEEISLLTELAAWAMTEIELRRQIRLREHAEKTLRELSLLDGLTGLNNRRALERFLDEEVERSRRYQYPLGVVMIDLDCFKETNDRYGHPTGDEVLRHVARVIRRTIRTGDRAIRYGGDEFLLLLPETDKARATAVAERLQETYKNSFGEVESVTEPLTMSVGVASMPEDAASPEELLKEADAALYEAKRRRHNQRD